MSARVLVSTDGLSREQWLEYRRRGIGGSDASIVCGVNKYMSPLELWLQKTGQSDYNDAGEAAHWGSLLEPLVRDEFAKRTGLNVIQVPQILQSRKHRFMLANVDGVCRCPTHGKCIVEVKTASAYKANEWEDSIPYPYLLQVQHYMSVVGYDGAYICVLIGGQDFRWKFIPRDEAVINMLIQREADFWERVVDCVPPDLDGSDACVKFLSQRYPNSIPMSTVTLPDRAAELIQQYNEASAQLEQFTEQKQKVGNLLKEMLRENEIGIIGDSCITWKTITQERFDSKAFETEQPDLYKKYIRESSYRRFIIKAASKSKTSNQLRKAG